MELKNDFIRIQSILNNAVKTTGEFTKLKYKGGSEQKLLQIVVELHKFMSSKDYIEDNKLNPKHLTEISDIFLFLAINTEYYESLSLEEYSHLVDIIPRLSKCLLVHIMFGLDLFEVSSVIFEKFPFVQLTELLEEVDLYLTGVDPNVQLETCYIILSNVIAKIDSPQISNKDEAGINKLVNISKVLLDRLTGVPYPLPNWKKNKLYQYMGFTTLRLIDLLLKLNINNTHLQDFTDKVLMCCVTVFQAVTVKVYCSWAKVEIQDDGLQTIIAEKSYHVGEKYTKYPAAATLIQMLATIARKPMTLKELIGKADLDKIILNVNKGGPDQKQWLQALINTRVEKKEAVQCLNKWAHLCNVEDVEKLLNFYVHCNDLETREVVIKCASNLGLEELKGIAHRHFWSHGFRTPLNDNIEPELLLIFNKFTEDIQNEEHTKSLYLLFLQNPKFFLTYSFSECLKNHNYTHCLKSTFIHVKAVIEVDNIGFKILNEMLTNTAINSTNCFCFAVLFDVLLEIEYFTVDQFLGNVYFPLLAKRSLTEDDLEELQYYLQILGGLKNLKIIVKKESEEIVRFLFSLMTKSRQKFLEFNRLKHDITNEVVKIVKEKIEFNPNLNFPVESIHHEDDVFVEYYMKCLSTQNVHRLLEHLGITLDPKMYAESVSKLIQLLPSCVTSEWITISKEITRTWEPEKTVELLTDVIILLCQVVNTQKVIDVKNLHDALKYCLQSYSVVIQQVIRPDSNQNQEIHIAKHIIRLLCKTPASVKEEMGFSLVNVILEEALRGLAGDKPFVCQVVAINHPGICKVLAQKIMRKM